MKKAIILIVSGILLGCSQCLAFDGPANSLAAEGTNYVSISGGTTFASWAANIEYGRYYSVGHLEAGVNYLDFKAQSQLGTVYSIGQVFARSGFMYRLWHTYRYNFNIYIGGGAILGAEIQDPFGKLPYDQKPAHGTRFIYGFYPKFEMEYFFWRSLGVVLDINMPVIFNGKLKAVNCCNINLGLRFDF